jgi:hypothetical protein
MATESTFMQNSFLSLKKLTFRVKKELDGSITLKQEIEH